MKRLILHLFIFLPYLVFCEDFNSVPLEHSVYDLLELMELKGIVINNSDVKPYTFKTVKKQLKNILSSGLILSEPEKNVLNSYINEFNHGRVLKHGLFIDIKSELKLESNSEDLHSYNVSFIGLKGNFKNVVSYNINGGFTLDKISPSAFEPYTFTKKYDGFHITSGKNKYKTGEYPVGFAFLSFPELNLSLFDDSLHLGLNRIRRNWGEGTSSMILAGSGRPILGFDYRWRLNNFITFNGLVGSLGLANNTRGDYSHYKNITTHYIEVKPNRYIDIVLFDSAIWGKRDEIGYLFLMPTFLTQQIVGDVDNIAIGGTITGRLPGVGKLYFTLFIDEMENDEWSNFFSYNKNMYAWNTGFKTVLPKIPFGILSFQYTKIEPYCYAHYEQEYPHFGETLIDTSFTNDNENIAYNLPPNSDQFLVDISAKPYTGLTTKLTYSYIRHGDNEWKAYDDYDFENGEKVPVGGAIDKYLTYTDHENRFEHKDFLNDGIYEFIHTISLKLNYSFSLLEIPLDLMAGYSFVTAKNYNNIKGNDIDKNIITLGFKSSF